MQVAAVVVVVACVLVAVKVYLLVRLPGYGRADEVGSIDMEKVGSRRKQSLSDTSGTPPRPPDRHEYF